MELDLMAAFPREHRIKGLIYDYPSLMVAIILSYLYFVLKFGPDFMRDRKPYNLRALTRVYNIIQVAGNVWFLWHSFFLFLRYSHTDRIRIPCTPPTTEQPDLEGPGDTELLIYISTGYLYVRILDFLDTVFFILAKKFTHVTFLHVYHHVAVVSTGYVYLRSGWGTTILYGTALNASIHVIMYSYYFLSTFASLRPFLWWKRYLTALQIVQFIIMATHMVWLLVENCGFPNVVVYYNTTQVLMFLVLFTRFYIINYTKPAKMAALKSTMNGNGKISDEWQQKNK